MESQLDIGSWRANNLFVQLMAVLFILLSACSSLWGSRALRSDSSSESEISKELNASSSVHSEEIRIVSDADSTEKRVIAEIIPSGRFSYSAAGGFRGKAERLLVNEQVKTSRSRNELLQQVQNSRVDSQSKVSAIQLAENRSKQKEREPPDLSWLYLAGCALIFVLIYWFRKALAN